MFRLLFLGLTEELLQNQSLNRRTLCQPFVTAVPNLGYKETHLSEKNK